ncbi:MAG: DNA-binding protein [Bacteroides sp.]|nr:DNA-binding protein [Roseburia sp.]MCM1346034.1 DNA-binding protein [Bacteroides sp.]MCM1420195.1 DNA-binding protein [Bacteroides sp.]
MTISFNQLRLIKASLPVGSIRRIAAELNMEEETVRNYFGGDNYSEGCSVGIHFEPGPDGGICQIDDPTVLNRALEILKEMN